MEVTCLSMSLSMVYCTAFYFTMAYNGDDPSGIMFVEVSAPGEKYVLAMDRQEISAGYGKAPDEKQINELGPYNMRQRHQQAVIMNSDAKFLYTTHY